MTQRLVILLLSIHAFYSCNSQEEKLSYNPKAIELDNKAAEFITAQKYDSALILLDKATEIDTTYYIAYANKTTIYCNLKNLPKALIEAENAIKAKPDLAEGLVLAGMLNEKLGDTVKAFKYYDKSIQIFDERILNKNKQKYLEANRVNRAFSLMLLGKEKEAKEELIKLKSIYPKNDVVDDLLNTNKQEYMNKLLKAD